MKRPITPIHLWGHQITQFGPEDFPIDLVQKPWDQQMSLPIVQSDAKRLGVLQSLADFQPDVDAIYRLTKKTPFLFKRPPIRKLQGTHFNKSIF